MFRIRCIETGHLCLRLIFILLCNYLGLDLVLEAVPGTVDHAPEATLDQGQDLEDQDHEVVSAAAVVLAARSTLDLVQGLDQDLM